MLYTQTHAASVLSRKSQAEHTDVKQRKHQRKTERKQQQQQGFAEYHASFLFPQLNSLDIGDFDFSFFGFSFSFLMSVWSKRERERDIIQILTL